MVLLLVWGLCSWCGSSIRVSNKGSGYTPTLNTFRVFFYFSFQLTPEFEFEWRESLALESRTGSPLACRWVLAHGDVLVGLSALLLLSTLSLTGWVPRCLSVGLFLRRCLVCSADVLAGWS